MTTARKLTYLVDLPVDRIGEIQEFLKGMDTDIDPIGNIAVYNDGAADPSMLMGNQIPEHIRAINEFNESCRKGQKMPSIPEFDESWTPRACDSFLNFAICFYHWDERNRIEYEIEKPDEEAWENVLREIARK